MSKNDDTIHIDVYITPRHFLYLPLAASEGVTERAHEAKRIAIRRIMINCVFIGINLGQI